MSVPASHFEALYDDSADPYGFGDRWYEQRKRAITLAALPKERFANGFEPGCSVGYLSRALADRCDRLLACDVSAVAVARARNRLAGCAHVSIEQRALPGEWPDGHFDLIVISELAYYFDDHDLMQLVQRTVDSLDPGGTLVLCHWCHDADHPQTAETVQAAFERVVELAPAASYADPDFLLTVFVRTPPTPVSVAQAEGIV
jgi:SAM-dependent methyltransferase